MKPYTLIWPAGFEDFSWEIESKGWFVGLEILVDGKTLRPTFYDPVRLSQDVADDIAAAGIFCESSLIVIIRVTRERIERAVADLANSGELEHLAQERATSLDTGRRRSPTRDR